VNEPSRGWFRFLATISLALLLVALTLAPAGASGPPTLPVQMGRQFLPALGVAPSAPGQSTPLEFTLANPLPYALSNVSLTFEVYAFNPFPGTGAVSPPTGSPLLAYGSSLGSKLALSVGTVGPKASNWSAPVTLQVPGAAAAGTYAIRDTLGFVLNGSRYQLESVGNFPPALWKNASVLANGTPTVNLSRLGVSGILPETAVLVRSTSTFAGVLYALLAASGLLALGGGYVALRKRGAASSSGARSRPEESHAATAFGNRRNRPGD
jgi:hypothetical protein